MLHARDSLDDQEDDERYEDEIEHGAQEDAVIERHGSRGLSLFERAVAPAGEADEIIDEVLLPEQHGDGRRDDVSDERSDDLAEGGADDDADGEVERVPLHGEMTEVVEELPRGLEDEVQIVVLPGEHGHDGIVAETGPKENPPATAGIMTVRGRTRQKRCREARALRSVAGLCPLRCRRRRAGRTSRAEGRSSPSGT